MTMQVGCSNCSARWDIVPEQANSLSSATCPFCGAQAVVPVAVPKGSEGQAGDIPVSPPDAAPAVAEAVFGDEKFAGIVEKPAETSSKPARNRRQRSENSSAKAVIITLVVVLVGIAGFGIGYFAMSSNPLAGREAELETLEEKIEEAKASLEEMEGEITLLEDEKRTAGLRNDELEADAAGLERDIETLKEEILELEGKKAILIAWRSADILFYDPDRYCVGLKQAVRGATPGVYTLVAKDAGEGAATHAHRGAILGKDLFTHVSALTTQVYDQFETGDKVSDDLAAEIDKVIVLLDPETPEYVEYLDVSTGRRQLGRFLMADADAQKLTIGTIGGIEDVPVDRIEPGYARKRSEEEILADLSDVDFLDFCLLRATQSLTRYAPEEQLAMYCKVEMLGDTADVVKARLLDLFFGEGTYTEQEFFVRRLEETIYARLSATPNMDLLRENVFSSFLSRNPSLLERLFGVEPPSPEEAFATSMIKLAPLAAATHVLTVKIGPPNDPFADYHVWVELHDLRGRDRIIWGTEGDRKKAGSYDRFFLQSGTLANAIFVRGESPALEQPPVIEPTILGTAPNSDRNANSGLIVIEDQNETTVRYRTLFDNKLIEVPKDSFRTLTPLANHADAPQQIPMPDRVRYVAWRVTQAVLAPAAIINPDKGYTLPIGPNNGLEDKDRLRVVRHDRYDPEAVATFGTELNVTLIQGEGDKSSFSVNHNSGLPELFPDDNYVPEFGDIAYRAKDAGRTVVMIGTVKPMGFWNDEDAIRCGYVRQNPARVRALDSRALKGATLLRQAIHDSLRKQGVNVYDGNIQSSGLYWTHKIEGEVYFLGPRPGTAEPAGLDVRLRTETKSIEGEEPKTVGINLELLLPD